MLSKYRNKDWIRKYKFQFILSLCLINTPFLVYCHLFIDPNLTSFMLLGHYYELEIITVQTFIWTLLSGFTSIVILCILFFSVSDKWKYALLFPTVIFLESSLNYFNEFTGVKNDYWFTNYLIIIILIIIICSIDYKFFRKYRRQELNFKLTSLILKSSKYGLVEINRKIRELNDQDVKTNKSKLLYSLYHSKLYLDKLLKDNNWVSVPQLMALKKNWSVYAAISVLMSTSLWFLHYIIPKGTINYSLGFLTITPHGFYDVQVYIWFISRKLLVIVPMVTWFVTYHSWWRYAVLPPLILYLFQFWEASQEGYRIIEAYGNYRVLPLVFLCIILLLTISRIVRKHSHSLDTYEQLSMEIDYLIKKLGVERSGVGDYRKRYEQILNKLVRKDSTDMTLSELTRLQEELRGRVIS